MSDQGLQGYILNVIRSRGRGVNTAIGADSLASKASTYFGRPIHSREVRQTIHDLRMLDLPICSGAQGFFWPDCLQDVLETANSEFRGEARSMLLTARKLREA